jgi:glycosyltransferase involved in cell wall biosynthesis
MQNPFDVSVVIPLFNEEESLPELTEWIRKVVVEANLKTEIIFVNDGSSDNSWEVVKTLISQAHDISIKALSFRRNYGKAAALHCGFDQVQGEVVITMDADLQDNPEEIPELYRMITEEKFDMVSGWKKKRYDPLFSKNLPSKFYNWTARRMTGIQLHDFNCGLKAYRNAVVKSIEVYGDMHRYIPVLAKWAGFKKIGEKVVRHQERKYGVTKFGIERFIRGPLDLMSVMFISRFGKRPMHLFGVWGAIMFLIGALAALWVGVEKLIALNHGLKAPLVANNPFFFIALTAMIIGSQMFMAGFVAELVSRSGSERNKYLIAEKL